MEENTVEDTQEVSNGAGGEEIPVINDPKAVLEALERAKNDAKSYREKLEEREAAVNDLQAKIALLESDEGIGGYKRKIIDLQVKAALAKQGVGDPDRVSKFVSTEGLDLDDNGNLVGFEESLTKVKNDLPELFDPKRRVGGAADLFKNEEAKQKMTGTEIQVAKLFNH